MKSIYWFLKVVTKIHFMYTINLLPIDMTDALSYLFRIAPTDHASTCEYAHVIWHSCIIF